MPLIHCLGIYPLYPGIFILVTDATVKLIVQRHARKPISAMPYPSEQAVSYVLSLALTTPLRLDFHSFYHLHLRPQRNSLDDFVDEVSHAVGGQLGLEFADDATAAGLIVQAQSLQRDLDRVIPGGKQMEWVGTDLYLVYLVSSDHAKCCLPMA